MFTLYGDGSQTRDFVYVDDVVQALKLCQKRREAQGNVYNVGTGTPSSINDVLDIFKSETGIEPIIKYENVRKGDIQDSYAEVSELKSLGFSPKYNLNKGIAKYLTNEMK